MITKKTVFGILIIVVGTVIWSSQSPAQNIEKIALEKGIEFLLSTDLGFHGGASLLSRKLSIKCKDARLKKYVKGKYHGDFKNIQFYLKHSKSYKNPEFVLSDGEISELEEMESKMDKIILKARYCEYFSYINIMNSINQLERDGSYNSTHILKAVSIAQKKDCYEDRREELSKLINDLVDELTEAQARAEQNGFVCNNRNIDIYAETALYISDAGFPLKDEWIENILNCQQTDGGWFTPHSTSLSLLAIAKTLGRCQ